jgi:hypothetical protein
MLTRRAGLCPIDQAPKRAEAILRHVFDGEAVRIILGVKEPRSARSDCAREDVGKVCWWR